MKSLWARLRAAYYRTLVRLVRRNTDLLVCDRAAYGRAVRDVFDLHQYVRKSGHMNTLKGRTPKARKRIGRSLENVEYHLGTAWRVQP